MTQKNKIAIIGSGALGTALAKVLYDSGHENICIYGVVESEVNDLKKGINTKYFPNSVKLPKFNTTTNINEALDGASYVVMAVPSKVMDVAIAQVLGSCNSEFMIINGSKGFYPATHMSLHVGIKHAIKDLKFVRGVVSLIGPSHAEEIVMSVPTVVAAVDKDKKHCEEVQALFSNDYFKTYVQTDVKGAEVGAAYKNVLAIASGISRGLGFGINTEAALLTRGLAEMRRFNKVMKGKDETLAGLTGIGDLIVTATSNLSRNFTFGQEFAKKGQDALKTTVTVEGLVALDVIYDIAKEKQLDLPIINNLYKAIHGKLDPSKMVKALWKREHKAE